MCYSSASVSTVDATNNVIAEFDMEPVNNLIRSHVTSKNTQVGRICKQSGMQRVSCYSYGFSNAVSQSETYWRRRAMRDIEYYKQ